MIAPATRRFFHISPDWCGQERVAQLFRLNGFSAVCHEDGRLAEHLAWAHVAGQRPLRPWAGAHLFAGLGRVDRIHRPPLACWRLFDWLDDQFPDAVFILTTRDPELWITDRLTRDNGRTATACAYHLVRPVCDLPDLWSREWQAHLDAVQAHFGDDPRLVGLDMDHETPNDLCDRLSPWIDLPRRPQDRNWLPVAPDHQAVDLLDRLDDNRAPLSDRRKIGPDHTLARDIADFCLAGLAPDDAEMNGVSALYGHWDGAEAVTRRNGSPWPIAFGPSFVDDGTCAFAAPGTPKLERLEGVLNDILALGRRDAVHVDMEDARWLGSDPAQTIGMPVLCHNRRQGARNAVLWPLPGYHVVGLPGFALPESPDTIPWDDKIDRVIWRGNLSGTVRRPVGQRRGPAAHAVLKRLSDAGDDPQARNAVLDDLNAIPRFDFLRRFAGDADFDAGLVMAYHYRDYAADPFIAPFCKPWIAPRHLHRFRYQLCLEGYDHPTGFISAINSQSVLMKEEDGWEVFYSGRFKPWKHFIPIARYAMDIREKLEWARKNPSLCKEMSVAARAEVAALANIATQDLIKGYILDGVAAAV